MDGIKHRFSWSCTPKQLNVHCSDRDQQRVNNIIAYNDCIIQHVYSMWCVQL